MLRHKLTTAVIAFVATMALTACGSGDSTGSNTASESLTVNELFSEMNISSNSLVRAKLTLVDQNGDPLSISSYPVEINGLKLNNNSAAAEVELLNGTFAADLADPIDMAEFDFEDGVDLCDNKLRLFYDSDGVLVDDQGISLPLKEPSIMESGLKVQGEAEEGEDCCVIDANSSNMIDIAVEGHQTGNGTVNIHPNAKVTCVQGNEGVSSGEGNNSNNNNNNNNSNENNEEGEEEETSSCEIIGEC